jgi:helicase
VAFHHADLTSEERSVVEAAYRRGELRVIACTTTLAFGVNLPASTVFVEPMKWDTDARTGTPVEVSVSWAEYENISGRAGRLGFREEFGRSVVIAVNQFQADLLWSGYILGEQEQFALAPGQAGFADRVLNVIASKICATLDEVVSFFELTYLGFLRRGAKPAQAADTAQEVEKILDSLIQAQLLNRSEDGRLEASSLGEVAARRGIQAATAVKLARFFSQARDRAVPELELFHLFSLTADGKRVYVPLSTAEHRSRVYESMLNEQLPENDQPPGEELKRLLHASMLPTSKEVRSAKLSLLLNEWIKGDALSGLESRYRCYAGTIKALTDEISWLADAANEVAEVMGWTAADHLKDLADCVRFGVGPDGLALARAQLPGLGREAVRALVAAGFDSPSAVQEASSEVLAAYLSPSQIETLHAAG